MIIRFLRKKLFFEHCYDGLNMAFKHFYLININYLCNNSEISEKHQIILYLIALNIFKIFWIKINKFRLIIQFIHTKLILCDEYYYTYIRKPAYL